MKYIILFTIFLSNTAYNQTQESIYERINLAESYVEAGFKEDAIEVYKNIISIQTDILGENNLELINILFSISDLYFSLDITDSSEVYLKKALDIQYYNFLNKQKLYIPTYEKLKNIYLLNSDSTKVSDIDSIIVMLHALDNESIYIKSDSLLKYPQIISLKPDVVDSTNLVSEYTLNDKAIEMINSGVSLIEAGLFSESIRVFDQAVKLNSKIIDLNFLINVDYGDSLKMNDLLNAYLEVEYYDSSITTQHLFKAILYDKRQNPQNEIINSLSQHINYYQDDIKGYLYMANLYFDNNEYLDAMHYYYRLLRLEPNHIFANLQLAECLIYFKDYVNAISILNLIVSLDENNFKSKYHLGYCLYQLGKHQDAIHEFTQALLLESNDAQTYYYLGKAYLYIEKKKQALESFMMSINLDPFNGNAHFELGKIYESILKKNLALEEYKLADKYIDNHELNYKYGLLLYNEQFYREAIYPLRAFIIFEENNTEILEILGDIFIKESRYPEAVDTYNRLIEQSPDNEFYHVNLANAYYQLNNYSIAKKYYQKVLSFNEENADILFQLGTISNLLYEYEDAQEYLLESISCSHTSKKLLFELGLAYGGQKKYLQALMALKESLNYSLDDPILHYQLGAIYQEMFIFDLAIQEYKIYSKTYKNDPIVYRLIGDSYVHLNNYQDAIINYRKASELYNYTDISSLYNLGNCYFELEDFKNAAKYFKSVLRINYDHAETHASLIPTYINLNKYKEAKKECDILYMLDRNSYNSIGHCMN